MGVSCLSPVATMVPLVVLMVLALGNNGLGGAQILEIEGRRSVWDGFGEIVTPKDWLDSHARDWDARVKIWENRTLVFSVDGAAFDKSEQDVIYEGIEELSARTCVTLQERKDEFAYVNITRFSPGCWSFVGRQGSAQELNLAPGCIEKKIVIHELMHALGYEHEHCRPVRDDYVTINFDNILQGQEHNFGKRSYEEEELIDLPYDYESILHYGMYAFAIDPKVPTIIPKRPNVTLGGEVLTPTDVQKVERLYSCGR